MSSPKEPNFFSTEYDRGLDWYKQCFSEPARAYGEASVNYTKKHVFGKVPSRMFRLLPNVKLLYIVRDPIERIISHYTHNCAVTGAEHQEIDPIDVALLPPNESGYVQTSRYHYQIAQYLTHYSMENILLIESERLREMRSEVLAKVFEFIGVDPTVEMQAFQDEHHETEGKRTWSTLGAFLINTSIGKKVKNGAKFVIPSQWVERVKETLREDVRKPMIDAEVEERVRTYLKDDVEKLRQLTGRDFDSWSI
jgi:hypothetical protein